MLPVSWESVKRSMRGVMRAQRSDWPREKRAAGVIKKWSANSCSCNTTVFILREGGQGRRGGERGGEEEGIGRGKEEGKEGMRHR